MPANRIHLICAALAASGSILGFVKMKRFMASRDIGEEKAEAAERAAGLDDLDDI